MRPARAPGANGPNLSSRSRIVYELNYNPHLHAHNSAIEVHSDNWLR